MSDFRQTTIQENLRMRARILGAVRRFFIENGFLEIETPLRIQAPAPEPHIQAFQSEDRFLQTSPELGMKRLVAAGYERIFQICKAFRRGERGDRHLPEFSLLEWYGAGLDYQGMMGQTEALVRFVAESLGSAGALTYQEKTVDLCPPWERLTVSQAFWCFAGTTPAAALANDRFDEIVGCAIEPKLGWQKPVFLYDYPAPCAALARRKPDQPDIAERFELYIAGTELCNGFGELTDSEEQRSRFQEAEAIRQSRGHPPYPLPESFLAALSHMPPASGNALGLDRLVMLFAGADTIDQVVAFAPEEI